MGMNAAQYGQSGGGGAVMSGAGAFSSAIGAYASAKSQKLMLQGQAAMSEMNARLSEKSAQQELARGNAEIATTTRRAGQIKGAQRAAMAANGIDLGEGSAAEVLTSTDILKEEDVNTIHANAVRAAWGQRIQATNYQNAAIMQRAGAASISPGMAAATSLMGNSKQIANGWYALTKKQDTTPNAQNVAPRGT